eukprot:gene8912-9830_t
MALIPSDVKTLASSSKKRKNEVLEEEEYIARLEYLIERDYFPHLSSLRNMLNYLEEHDNYDLYTLRQTYRKLFPNLPSHNNKQEQEEIESGEKSGGGKMTIAQFFNRYISEDNQSFLTLQEKSIKQHRQKYHWMYEALDLLEDGSSTTSSSSLRRPGTLMLYYIGNKVLTVKERENIDRILDGNVDDDIDKRQNGLSTWAFRVRNQLMFYPELRDSQATCQMIPDASQHRPDRQSILPIQNEKNSSVGLITDFAFKAPSPRPPRMNNNVSSSSEKIVQRANVHALGNEVLQEMDDYLRGMAALSPLEMPHTPSSVGSMDNAMTMRAEIGNKRYREVEMTPLAVPGKGALASPLMTWGAVAATPLLLSSSSSSNRVPATPREYSGNNEKSRAESAGVAGPHFSMQPTRQRDKIALALDAKFKKRRASYVTPLRSSGDIHSQASVNSAQTWRRYSDDGLVGRTGNAIGATERRKLSDLSLAAQNLAKKINPQLAHRQ